MVARARRRRRFGHLGAILIPFELVCCSAVRLRFLGSPGREASLGGLYRQPTLISEVAGWAMQGQNSNGVDPEIGPKFPSTISLGQFRR